jgi:hypothetical protein
MSTLQQVLERKRKIRKCPFCKSNQGVEINYSILGNGMMKVNFHGQTLDAHREVFDQMPLDVTCLNCGKLIDIEYIKTEYI